MPKFWVIFEKVIEVSVEAPSKEALQEAAQEALGELDIYWEAPPWQCHVSPIPEDMQRNMNRADCGLTDVGIADWDEYQEWLKKQKIPNLIRIK